METPVRPSNLFRARLCPPAPWREALCEDLPGPEAIEGTLLHEVVRKMIMGEDLGGLILTGEQQAVVDSCIDRFGSVIYQGEGVPTDELHCEEEVEFGGIVGSPDAVRVACGPDRYGEVFEWKTGRAAHDFPAAHDLQLRHYMGGVHKKYGVEIVNGTRFHPRIWDETRETSTVISRDWNRHEDMIAGIVEASKPDVAACPGALQCKYCKARKGACVEHLAWIDQVPALIPASISDFTPTQIATILAMRPRLALAVKIAEAATDRAREILQGGGALVDADGREYALQDRPSKRDIPDAALAWERLAEVMPEEAIRSAASLAVGATEKALRSALGLKAKDAKAKLAEVLGDAMELKEMAPAVVAVPESLSLGD